MPASIAGWGSVINPKRDGKFDLAADALTITVPAGKYNLNPTPEFNNLNAPRVLRSVSGDFQFDARVGAFPLPQAGPGGVKDSYVGAGLLLWQDERNFVRFIRAANGATRKEYIHFEYFRDGQLAVSTALNFPNPPAALRVVRTGNDFRYYWSFDGTKWVEYPVKVPVSLAYKVDVGICAINTLETPFTARFSDPQFRAAWAVQGFVPLFNGKDLTGWSGKFPNAWSVEDGILIGRGKNGSTDGWSELVHPRDDFKDFHLRAEARINASGWAGIRVRKQKDSLDGYKIWLSNDPEKTGAGPAAWTWWGKTMRSPSPTPRTTSACRWTNGSPSTLSPAAPNSSSPSTARKPPASTIHRSPAARSSWKWPARRPSSSSARSRSRNCRWPLQSRFQPSRPRGPRQAQGRVGGPSEGVRRQGTDARRCQESRRHPSSEMEISSTGKRKERRPGVRPAHSRLKRQTNKCSSTSSGP